MHVSEDNCVKADSVYFDTKKKKRVNFVAVCYKL